MLELHLWKIISSEFLNKTKKKKKLDSIIGKLRKLSRVGLLPKIDRSNMEIIKNNLRKAKTNLKNVQAKAKELRKTHLRQSAEEAEAEENFTHARYLRNLISIENQQLMHRIIKSFQK